MPMPQQKASLRTRLQRRAHQLKTDLPAVFLALGDPRTPFLAKLLGAVTVVYALSPIDLVPDWIPVLGYLDDVLLLPGLCALTLRHIPPAVLSECRVKSENLWNNGKPRRWYYALPVVVVWGAVAWFIVRAFLH